MIHRSKVNQSGFTLVELVIVLLVTTIISVSLATFIFQWINSAGLEQTQANLQTNAENALDTLNTDVMLSGNVDQTNRWPDNYGPGGNQFGWTSSSSVLILAKVAVDSSGNAIYQDSADYITLKDDEVYYLSGSTLYRRTLASGIDGDTAVTTCPAANASPSCPADTVIATGVTSWSVAYYDNANNLVSPDNARSVQINLNISTPYGNEPVNGSYSERMVFRNV